MTDPLIDPAVQARLVQIMAEQGFDTPGMSPHSWRCDHPDRYPGYCTCVHDMVTAILTEFTITPRSTDASTDQRERYAGTSRQTL